jgi:hypothetical protein
LGAVGLRLPRGTFAWAVAVAAALAVLALAAAVFDLGPFRGSELTRGELIARGDDICRKAHDAFIELQARPPRTADEAAELTGRLADIAADELKQIKALHGPPEFDAELERYLAAREQGIEALRDGVAAAQDGDTAAYTSAQAKLASSQRRRRQIARRIGFAECSRPLPG